MVWPVRKNQYPSLPDITLDGFRIILRPARLSDYESWVSVRGNNEKRLRTFEPTWAENWSTEEFFERRLLRQARNWRNDQGYYFLIFEKQKDALIGGMNINHVCRGAAQYASLGYWIDEGHEGQGYMAESGRLVVRYCFDTLRLRRLNAACLVDNHRSITLLERLDFEREGFAKSYLQINGTWQDHILFGLAGKAISDNTK